MVCLFEIIPDKALNKFAWDKGGMNEDGITGAVGLSFNPQMQFNILLSVLAVFTAARPTHSGIECTKSTGPVIQNTFPDYSPKWSTEYEYVLYQDGSVLERFIKDARKRWVLTQNNCAQTSSEVSEPVVKKGIVSTATFKRHD